MKNTATINKVLINAFLIFYVISVFLDLHIFYNPISTLIRTVFISIIFIITLINNFSVKHFKYFILYGAVLLFYILMHHINATNFYSLVPGNFNYSFLSELLYIFKILSNIMIFYIVCKLNIKYVNVKKYIKLIVTFITLSIIISDLLSLSYTAYNFEHTTIPIFKWFNYDIYDFMAGSSKGFFHLSNQIVAVLLLYFPLICYEAYSNKKPLDYILQILIVVSMLMIGNRLAIYGTLIEIFILTIIYFILNIKKGINKFGTGLNILICVGVVLIIPFSPLSMRNEYYNAIYNNKPIDFIKNSNAQVTKEYEVKDDLIVKLESKQIDPNFYKVAYPYQYDKEFWQKVSDLNIEQTGNARFMELAMIKRVKQINDNNLDDWFGLTYSRVMNIFNIEQDFVMQYYSLGVIGVCLFLGLYFILLIYCIIKITFDLKNKYTEKNIALLLGCGLMFISSYYSGNILNATSTIIPLSVVLSILVNEVRIKKENTGTENILGFNVTTLSMDSLIPKIFDNKTKFIVNINPFIILDHKNDLEKKKLFNKEKIQIPDGEGIVLISKLRGGNIKRRIAGIDLMLKICQESSKYNHTVFLYGAKKGVAAKAKLKLEEKYSNIKIVGTISGYDEEEKVISKINASKANILFVALGSPLQEDFIIRNKKRLKYVKVFMPVGGSFDVISGNLKRAPKIIQKLKLEWLYRMILEPKRIKGVFRLIIFVVISIFDKEV